MGRVELLSQILTLESPNIVDFTLLLWCLLIDWTCESVVQTLFLLTEQEV